MVNAARDADGVEARCRAFIADPPMADEMLPEVKVGGLPEFPRRTLFHALNSRAMVRRYARSVGKTNKDVTVIVAHMGGGSSVSLHRNGLVIDVNDSLGGDGPISPERAGSVPGFPLVDKCFRAAYSLLNIEQLLLLNFLFCHIFVRFYNYPCITKCKSSLFLLITKISTRFFSFHPLFFRFLATKVEAWHSNWSLFHLIPTL